MVAGKKKFHVHKSTTSHVEASTFQKKNFKIHNAIAQRSLDIIYALPAPISASQAAELPQYSTHSRRGWLE
jgi:hypothetical protein